ncbi:MAG TPA: hypothetical protein VMT17_18395 [Anaeromyxobacteraceae bacterium]|nr:hypothetical protein [Anaeromyxobacteraceae bacterium]
MIKKSGMKCREVESSELTELTETELRTVGGGLVQKAAVVNQLVSSNLQTVKKLNGLSWSCLCCIGC